MHIQHEVIVNCPVEEVWSFMEDLRNYPKWQSGLVAMQQISDGPMGTGARIAAVHQFLGRRLDLVVEVTGYDPGKLFAAQVVSGPVRFRGNWRYAPVDGGTRISGVIEGDTGGFFKLAEPLVSRAARRQIDAYCATLKDLIESHPLAAPVGPPRPELFEEAPRS